MPFRHSKTFHSSYIWELFAAYFPVRLHRSAALVSTRKYISGYHPHGIMSHGAFAAFGADVLGFSTLFLGITNSLLTLDSNFLSGLPVEHGLRFGVKGVV
jgi:2-acylglycerol O-acyltransferase 2